MPRPPLFRDLSLETAHAEAASSGKVVLVDVTGEHCPPCKQMDKTTWRAAEVEAWVAAHAIAVQLDQTDPAVEPLGVMAVPTLLLFRDRKELDRSVGGRGPAELLAWLDGVLAGKTELDGLRDVAPDDLQGRMRLADALMMRGLPAEALREYLWLWQHGAEADPAWIGVRQSFLLREIEALVAQSREAGEAFARLRDAAGESLGEAALRADFLALNEVLGESGRSLAWWDSVKHAPLAGLENDPHLLSLLEREGRWADLGRLVRDPVAALRREAEIDQESREHLPPEMPEEFAAQLQAFMAQHLRERAAALLRAMRAAGRDSEAEAVAAQARKLDGSREMEEALAGADAAPRPG